MTTFKHALIIGGTGMLAAASRHIAQQAQHCTVIGRDIKRLQALSHETLHPVELDYTDLERFEAQLTTLSKAHGPFDLALFWIHASGQLARERLYQKINSQPIASRMIEVLGSAAADPSQKLSHPEIDKDKVTLIQVVLGFQIEARGSRWLNHAEISQGTITALSAKESPVIVGQVRPWSARP